MKRRVMIVLLPAFVLVAVIVIFAVTLFNTEWSDPVATEGDIEFPEFVYRTARAERGYRLAVDNQQLFAQLPCYCGCVLLPDDPHGDLLDCFINDDGSFDNHASGCLICVDIADDGVAWHAEGRSAAEVKTLLDEKYQDSGPSTNS